VILPGVLDENFIGRPVAEFVEEARGIPKVIILSFERPNIIQGVSEVKKSFNKNQHSNV